MPLLPPFSLSCCAGAGSTPIESNGIAATDASKNFLILSVSLKVIEWQRIDQKNVPARRVLEHMFRRACLFRRLVSPAWAGLIATPI
jgi:hypothetical protein